MMRIHIIGPPGSGKTTLAQRLASSLQLPLYELDYIAWEEGYPETERPLEIRLRDIRHIATQPAWITEGVFLTWIDELLRSADYIVWLDVPLRLTLRQTLFRRLRNDFGESPPPTSLLKQFKFLAFMGRYYYSKKLTETRWSTLNSLKVYQNKLAHCRSLNESEAFLKSILEQYQEER